MTFLSFLISGISLGSIYAIIALGYTMVYGIAKMLNFAHGDVIMVGAYICFYATSRFELPAIAGVLLAIVVCTILGIVIERLADVHESDSAAGVAPAAAGFREPRHAYREDHVIGRAARRGGSHQGGPADHRREPFPVSDGHFVDLRNDFLHVLHRVLAAVHRGPQVGKEVEA